MTQVVTRPIGIARDVIRAAFGRYEGSVDASTYSMNSQDQKCQKNNDLHDDGLRMKALVRSGRRMMRLTRFVGDWDFFFFHMLIRGSWANQTIVQPHKSDALSSPEIKL